MVLVLRVRWPPVSSETNAPSSVTAETAGCIIVPAASTALAAAVKVWSAMAVIKGSVGCDGSVTVLVFLTGVDEAKDTGMLDVVVARPPVGNGAPAIPKLLTPIVTAWPAIVVVVGFETSEFAAGGTLLVPTTKREGEYVIEIPEPLSGKDPGVKVVPVIEI